MAGFFKTLGSFFSYTEPQNIELGFELLEDENEGTEGADTQNSGKPNTSLKGDTQKQGNTQKYNDIKKQSVPQQNNTGAQKKSGKQPLSVEKWNETRKAENLENPCEPQNHTNTISADLCANLETIRQKFLMPKNKDVIIREIKIGRKVKAFMAYLEGMIDKNTLNLSIFPQLMAKDVFEEMVDEGPVDYLMENVLTVHQVNKSNLYSDAVTGVLHGVSALFIEGCSECIIIETKGYEKRSVEKPITETVVKGSQEGFNENLRTNLTLIRRIIKNENLVTEILPVGNTNHASCAVIYLEGVANPKVVQEVMKRIKNIDADFILGDGMLEQFIEDNSFMLFPQVLTTERPDRTASYIMEGHVAVIAEGTPFAIVAPVTFFGLLHTSEDSFVRWPASNFLRIIRMFGLFCATLLPGLYVALTLYHVEMIPTELLLSIARAKELVPFPTVLEVLMMEIAFELIREGGIRVPSVVGQTLGIVGALILGQAAVAAGLVSPLLVIVVSITALGSFVIPNYTLGLAVRIERFLFIAAGGFLGFYGISLMAVLLTCFACSMKSFGVPFFSPVAPRTKTNPDVISRYPIWMQRNRPDYLNTPNRRRQGDNKKMWITEKDQDDQDKGDNT